MWRSMAPAACASRRASPSSRPPSPSSASNGPPPSRSPACAAWPGSVWAAARSSTPPPSPTTPPSSRVPLWQFYGTASANVLDLSTRPFPGAARPSPTPAARPLARWQAERGSRHATNLRHEASGLEEFARQVLRLLDGKREAGDLVEALAACVAGGGLSIHHDGDAVGDPARVRTILAEALGRQIEGFARGGLLVT